MKKINKIISVLLSGIISLSMLGSLGVNATKLSFSTDILRTEDEKIYKMSELLPMSKEEFLAIDKAENAYSILFIEPDKFCPEKTLFKMEYGSTCFDYEEYKPYYTMKKLKEILDEPIEEGISYKVFDHVINPPEIISDCDTIEQQLGITLIKNGSDEPECFYYTSEELKKEDVQLKLAKLTFCINQVIRLYLATRMEGTQPLTVMYGDVNDDKKISISDAAFIAKKIACRNKEELTEAADINRDGEANLRDCVYIARLMNARHLAKADGLFE